jgi:acetyl-CoA carboxylase biotin carboxyl carrier protein
VAEKTLIANVRSDTERPGTVLVTSPVVGRADGVPRVGVFLNPFDVVLTMDILNERYKLRLPRDVHGRVVETYVPRALTPVAFNTPLVRLDPRALEPGTNPEGGAAGTIKEAEQAAAEGMIEVTSPTEGIFYRRSSPDEPPYVEEGAQISSGSVLGLVEVMKCFNQITYGGPGFPDKVEVAKILVQDSKEVQFDQPLFWVRPLD